MVCTMALISVIIMASGLIILARSALFWLYFIQTKHYRLDRIWLEVKSRSFWRLIFSPHRGIIIALLIVWFFTIIGMERVKYELRDWQMFASALFVPTYIFIYATVTARTWLQRRLILPRRTLKIAILFCAAVGLETIVVLLPFYLAAGAGALGNLFSMLMAILFFGAAVAILEIIQPFIVLGFFTLAYTPNIFLHRYFISRAREKINTHKNLIVVGITGSYGKTTTKEYLAHILSKKYKVLKTPAHINVDTGVAKVILRELKPEHEIFIVEMGAYKRGEIKKICDLVRPKYAVMTGLSDQHLELFGSMAALAEAKFELVSAVNDQSHIIANADSELLVSEFKHRRIMPVWYGINSHAARFKPTDVSYSVQGTSFILHGIKFHSPAFGVAALNNLLGAITAAVELGLHLDEIAQLISDLPKIPDTMEVRVGINEALIIDDTYNANTKGVMTALNDLNRTHHAKRIFVFKNIIELGSQAKKDHERIAEVIATNASHTMLIPSEMTQPMLSKLRENGYAESQLVKSIDELKKLLDGDAVVLFEGRDAGKILKIL